MLYASADKGKSGGFDDSPHNKVIATYRLGSIDIHLKRMLITEMNAYPFYSPIYYSEGLYISNRHQLDSLVSHVIDGKDTVITNLQCIGPITYPPEILTVIKNDNTHDILERIYFDSSAFLNRPKAPF